MQKYSWIDTCGWLDLNPEFSARAREGLDIEVIVRDDSEQFGCEYVGSAHDLVIMVTRAHAVNSGTVFMPHADHHADLMFELSKEIERFPRPDYD